MTTLNSRASRVFPSESLTPSVIAIVRAIAESQGYCKWRGSVEKILIISDDPSSQTVVRSLLMKVGYDVEMAARGNTAIHQFQTTKPSLVILDDLPSRVLHDRCCQIRSQSLYIPLFVLSVVSEVEQVVQLLELGADDYITKPFHPSEFLARIRAALRHRVVR
jgi:two-component system KDP operon response regulator KdpE